MWNCHLIRLVFAVVVAHEIQGSTFQIIRTLIRFREMLLALGSKIKANPQVSTAVYLQQEY